MKSYDVGNLIQFREEEKNCFGKYITDIGIIISVNSYDRDIMVYWFGPTAFLNPCKLTFEYVTKFFHIY